MSLEELLSEQSWWNATSSPDLDAVVLSRRSSRKRKTPLPKDARSEELRLFQGLLTQSQAGVPSLSSIVGTRIDRASTLSLVNEDKPKKIKLSSPSSSLPLDQSGKSTPMTVRTALGRPGPRSQPLPPIPPKVRTLHRKLYQEVLGWARRQPEELSRQPPVLMQHAGRPPPIYSGSPAFTFSDQLLNQPSSTTTNASSSSATPVYDVSEVWRSEGADTDEWRPGASSLSTWARKTFRVGPKDSHTLPSHGVQSVRQAFLQSGLSRRAARIILEDEFRRLNLNLDGYLKALSAHELSTVLEVMPILQRNQNLSNKAMEALAICLFSEFPFYQTHSGAMSMSRFQSILDSVPGSDPSFPGQDDPLDELIVAEDQRRYRSESQKYAQRQKQFVETLRTERNLFLEKVLKNSRKLRKSRESRHQRASFMATACQKAVQAEQKRRELSESRERRNRMKALQENDMQAYQELISQHKDSRLGKLLDDTHTFLQQLSDRLQTKNPGGATSEPISSGKAAVSTTSSSSNANSRDLASLAHVVKESITQQPSILASGLHLRDYQMQGLEWLVSLYNNGLNGILADEMGLGKTIQSIALFAHLMEHKGNQGPFLVIVPLSTLSNWAQEFKLWAPSISVISYIGNRLERGELKKRLRLRSSPSFHVLLTTYNYVANRHDRGTLSSFPWEYIIVDEGHRLKNHQSQLATTLNTFYRSKYRVVLTGTPLQNNLNELWSLLNFLLPEIFNSTEDFDNWFNEPFRTVGLSGEDEAGAELLAEEEKMLIINRLHQVLRPFLLRRLKNDVATQLPKKVEIVLKCRISAWQKVIYKRLLGRAMTQRDPRSGHMKARVMSNLSMHLRKACNHPYLFLDEVPETVDEQIVRSSGKFDLLDQMLPKLLASGHKTLIFSQMTKVLDILEDYLQWRGLNWLRLDGGTPQADRAEMILEFQKPGSEYHIFLLSTRSGGLGLNLQSADTVIIFDSDWNPQADLQAQDRAHRIGQKNEVRVFRFCTLTPMESKMLEIAKFKLGMDAQVIGAGQFNRRKIGDAERRAALKEVIRAGVDLGKELEAPSPEELNQLLARSQDEFELFQKMDRERWDRELEELKKSTPKPERRTGKRRKSRSDDDTEGDIQFPPRLMTEDEVPEEARGIFRDTEGNVQTLRRDIWDVFEESQRKQELRRKAASPGRGRGRPRGKTPQVPLDLGVFENYGRGRRERKATVVEHLSEQLLVRAVEAGLDYNELMQEIAVHRADTKSQSPDPTVGRRRSRKASDAETLDIETIALRIIEKQEAANLEAGSEGFGSSDDEGTEDE